MRSPFSLPVGLAVMLATVVPILSGCGHNGDSGTAQVRMMNISTGYASLDLYASNNDNTNPNYVAELQGVSTGTLSSYANIGSATYSLQFRKNGVSSPLATDGSEKLVDSSHTTYVGYGSLGNFAVLKITEDQASADSGYSKVTVLNASEAGGLDVYLTDSTTQLVDASPVATVAPGSSQAITVTSGNYRLRVTATGDNTDLRLDVPQVTFNSTTVDSLILTSTTGGVLVNAAILPQQGSLTNYTNTLARIRGAVGIANGTTVNATVNGTPILTNATVGVIGGTYTPVTAGSAAIVLHVDGTAVSVPAQTLEAGGDYTFLVWSNSSGTQTTLIADDNAVPASIATTKAKVRVLNGMSGLGDPLTLEVNFIVAATDIDLGEASDPAEFASGSDNEVDVVDSNTSQTLLTKQTLTLNAGSVYTMFMTGSATTNNGTLRKDR